jgi:ribonucleoside-diphosphate reductase alpha chain
MMRTKHGKAANGRISTTGNGHQKPSGAPAMKIPVYFCPRGVDPFDTVEWDQRSAHIKD